MMEVFEVRYLGVPTTQMVEVDKTQQYIIWDLKSDTLRSVRESFHQPAAISAML